MRTVPKRDEIGQRKGTTVLYRLDRDRAKLLHSFPVGGDASYPGLVPIEERQEWPVEIRAGLVMSFYSDVAYQSGQVKPEYHLGYGYKYSGCDVYVAEIALEEQAPPPPAR